MGINFKNMINKNYLNLSELSVHEMTIISGGHDGTSYRLGRTVGWFIKQVVIGIGDGLNIVKDVLVGEMVKTRIK